MFSKWIPLGYKDFFRIRCRRAAGGRAASYRPRLEALEERAVPATITWDGGGITNYWTDRLNWVNDVLPVLGDDLLFPLKAAKRTSVNNFVDGTLFRSLTFSGSGYTISGTNQLKVGGGGISNSATSGTNSYNGFIQIDASFPLVVAVASGGGLQLGGFLGGSGGVRKSGPGTLTFNGAINTYTGSTDVDGGVLQLDEGLPGQSTIAIRGELHISSTATASGEVRLLRDDQIADTAPVTLTQGSSNFTPLLNLNGFADRIGPLNLTGGIVDTGGNTGGLDIHGDVTAQGFSSGSSFVPAVITGSANVSLGLTPATVTVNKPPGFIGFVAKDLAVSAVVTGSTLIKQGPGVLEINSGFFTEVDINAGAVNVLSSLSGDIALSNDGTLGGTGNVQSPIMASGIAADELLDNSYSIADGFTQTTGWSPITGQGGLLNSFLEAGPFAGSGSPAVAQWTFTNLMPGLYRVFTTWPVDPADSSVNAIHTTQAPYSIMDGTTLRGTFFVDQERAPTNGPTGPLVVEAAFQQLTSAVTITSGTLIVSLNNKVNAEPDGALVLADGVYIERLAGAISPGLGEPNAVGTLLLSGAVLGLGSTYKVDFKSTGAGANTADFLDVHGDFDCRNAQLRLSSSATSPFSPPTSGTAYRIITSDTLTPAFLNVPQSGDTIDLVVGATRYMFSIKYTTCNVDLIYQTTATQVSFLDLSPDVINEGERVSLRGALTDPDRGDVLSLRVSWGDGAVQTFTDLGTTPFQFTHTYVDNSPDGAPYLVRAEWFDQHGAGNFRKLFVTVNNLPPRLFLGGAEVIRAGEVMQHAGSFTDAGAADTWTATVDYGDGSGPQPLVIQPGQQLLFEHRYTRPGKYRVTVTVFDKDGGLSTDTFLVIVLPPL
jgi:autotransporter-associated beta strand protein